MRKHQLIAILSVTLLLMGCNNKTGDAETAKIEAHKQSICTSIANIAENAMKTRLDGAAIQDMLETTDNIDGSDPMDAALKIKSKEIIIEAYRLPNYTIDEQKERAIKEFGSAQYIKCMDDGLAEKLVRSQK